MKVFLDGNLVDEREARISVFDHGLLYGDGVFEGIRVYNKCVFKLEEHLERLENSAKAILLELPWSRQEISLAVCDTCRANNITDGYVRLVVTRGRGTLGLNPYKCSNPQLIVIADTIQLYPEEYYSEGLKIITVPTRRIGPGSLPPTIKSLNYLNNVLAKIEAINAGFMEAIMLNDQGFVGECTGDNLFIVQKDILFTPPSSAGALLGITRKVVLDMAQAIEIEVVESNLTRYDLWVSEECFLTGTAAEVVPVTEIDGRKIGNGMPGPVTRGFMETYKKLAIREGTFL